MTAAADALREAMADGPLTRRDVEALIGRHATRGIHALARPRAHPARGDVGAPPRRPWAGRRALARPAAGGSSRPRTGSSMLVRRYLGGVRAGGPADVADWAGLTVRALAPALERLDLRVRRAVDGDGARRPAGRPAPGRRRSRARALPADLGRDAAHARAAGRHPAGGAPPADLQLRNPHSFPTFLVDGVGRGHVAPRGGVRDGLAVRAAARPGRAHRRGGGGARGGVPPLRRRRRQPGSTVTCSRIVIGCR